MAEGAFGWLRAVWAYVDERLAGLSAALQRVVRMLRLARLLLVFAILLVLGSAVVGILTALGYLPQIWFAAFYAVSVVILVIPIILLTVLVGLPLRLRSVVRLIDQGYPANARELGIRIAARKLRDQSIETEELLVETAMNEGRKMYEKYQARAEAMDEEDRAATDEATRGPGRPPSA